MKKVQFERSNLKFFQLYRIETHRIASNLVELDEVKRILTKKERLPLQPEIAKASVL